MLEQSRRFSGSSFFLLCIAVAIAVACGQSESGDDGGGTQPPGWAACEVNSECVLSAAGCCDACGEPTLDDVDAINAERMNEHFADVCPEPLPCPLCPVSRNPDLHATCSSGQCLALDIRKHTASACASDDDCRLRATGCCECGASTATWDLIAFNDQNEGLYRDLVCDPGQGCDDCAPVYPTDVEAFCASDGHCDVRPANGNQGIDHGYVPGSACTPGSACGEGVECVELVAGGVTRCEFMGGRPTEPCSGDTRDECCASSECEEGTCHLVTHYPSGRCGLGGADVYNECLVDECSDDSDCPGGLCALGARRTCVAAACRSDSDCNESAGGVCRALDLGCCPGGTSSGVVDRAPATACVYPGDGCMTDQQCPSGSSCTIVAGRAACRNDCTSNTLEP